MDQLSLVVGMNIVSSAKYDTSLRSFRASIRAYPGMNK